MPNTKSAQKALRGSSRRREKNAAKKIDLKKVLKNYKKLAADKKTEEAQKQLSIVYKKLDKAVKAKIIKRNKADRLKSRLTKLLRNQTSQI